MSSITLKNIPQPLHVLLRRLAERNRRSLNSEIVKRLEDSVNEDGRNKQEFLQQVRHWREKLGLRVTSHQLNQYKRQGRP